MDRVCAKGSITVSVKYNAIVACCTEEAEPVDRDESLTVCPYDSGKAWQ